MCAIAGMIDLRYDENVIKQFLETMKRRGPDESGYFLDDDCALLHTRLAVVDLQGGKQPMFLPWNGDMLALVYNGELYNTSELQDELITLGHEFSGHGDTEVVIHAYAQWGMEALRKFNGIFAFAVWHVKERKLFIARDRMGVKPLFYKQHGNGFLFASEIKTILRYPTVDAELDETGVGQVLLLGPGREPGSGVFRNIFEVEPGCYGIYQKGKFRGNRYWLLCDHEHKETLEETKLQVRELVRDAVTRQMVSDVPIGCFLSGGLDSSIITAICAEKAETSGMVIDTFSVDYENNERYFKPGKFQPNADGEYIQAMCDAFRTQQHWSILRPEDLLEAMEAATIARDLPGMADVDFSLLVFCRQIRDHVKVALSGECADEIFGGYPWFRDPSIREQTGFPWAQNTAKRADFLNKEYAGKLNPEEFVYERYLQTIQSCDIRPDATTEERKIKQMVNLNFRWFMQTLLDRKDRMSMYNGLEVRVPFCDYRIAEYLYSVPWEFKEYGNFEKGLLRSAMKGIIPNKILYRRKSPYPKTHDPRYKAIVSEQLNEILRDRNAPILQIVRREKLENLLKIEDSVPWYGQLMNVPQTIAYMLQINFWLSHYHVRLI